MEKGYKKIGLVLAGVGFFMIVANAVDYVGGLTWFPGWFFLVGILMVTVGIIVSGVKK